VADFRWAAATFRTGDGGTPPKLLVMHAEVSEELRRRGVIRSSNNPIGDLAEHLFCRVFGWKQAPSSKRDADATDAAEVRYLIKGRRLMPHNNSRQLGALRDLPAQGFDVLAAVLFQADCRILRAALIPHARVVDLAKRVERTNNASFAAEVQSNSEAAARLSGLTAGAETAWLTASRGRAACGSICPWPCLTWFGPDLRFGRSASRRQ
jgi:hypothetical protein